MGLFFAQLLKAAHVPDRRIQPHVKIFTRRIGNLEAEVGRIARDVPIGEFVLAFRTQPFLHLVGGLGLQRAAARPFAQKLLAGVGREFEKIMVGIAQLRFCTGHGGVRVDQIGGHVGCAAYFAVVAILILGVALGTFAFDEAIRQEHIFDRVVELFDGADFDQIFSLQLAVNILRVIASLV